MKRMNFPHRRQKRKLEAEERQTKFDALSEYEKARKRGWTIIDLQRIGQSVAARKL